MLIIKTKVGGNNHARERQKVYYKSIYYQIAQQKQI